MRGSRVMVEIASRLYAHMYGPGKAAGSSDDVHMLFAALCKRARWKFPQQQHQQQQQQQQQEHKK
jgi:transcription initiation factor TFIID subunit TAF12